MSDHVITWGHLFLAAALLVLLYGAVQLATWLRYRGPDNGRGTPGYARARDARRYTAWSIAAAAILAAIGCLTPLCELALAGGPA